MAKVFAGMGMATIVALSAGSARADSGDLFYLSCREDEGLATGDCDPSLLDLDDHTDEGLAKAFAVAFTPDQTRVYVTSADSNALVIYDLAVGGELRWRGCWDDAAGNGVCELGALPMLKQAYTVTVAGSSVYVLSSDGASLLRFAWNPSLQRLLLQQCFSDYPLPAHDCLGSGLPWPECYGCERTDGLHGGRQIVVAPDGGSLYVVSKARDIPDEDENADDALVRFSIDATSGALTRRRTYVDVGATSYNPNWYEAQGLNGAHGVAVSSDSRWIYVVGSEDHAVAGFEWVGGELQSRGCWHDFGVAAGCGRTLPHLRGARSIAFRPGDDTNLFVAASEEHAIQQLTHTNGQLMDAGCASRAQGTGCTVVPELGYPHFIAALGDDVYVANRSSDTVTWLSIAGSLALEGCVADEDVPMGVGPFESCDRQPGLVGVHSLTISPLGNYVYAISGTVSGTDGHDNAIVTFDRQYWN